LCIFTFQPDKKLHLPIALVIDAIMIKTGPHRKQSGNYQPERIMTIVFIQQQQIHSARMIFKRELALCRFRSSDQSAPGVKHFHFTFFSDTLQADDAGRVGGRNGITDGRNCIPGNAGISIFYYVVCG
jgi:hypothetical protein